jgi:hypothetical protein
MNVSFDGKIKKYLTDSSFKCSRCGVTVYDWSRLRVARHENFGISAGKLALDAYCSECSDKYNMDPERGEVYVHNLKVFVNPVAFLKAKPVVNWDPELRSPGGVFQK